MLKTLQIRLLASTWTENFQMHKLSLAKAEEPENQIANIHWIMEKAKEFQKKHLLLLQKPLTVWITTHCGKFIKIGEYQTTLPVSWETCMQVKKQELELEWNSWVVQNWERDIKRLYIITQIT